MKQFGRKKFPRFLIATLTAFIFVCVAYVLVFDLLHIETRAVAHSNPVRANNVPLAFVSPIDQPPITIDFATFVPTEASLEPPTEAPTEAPPEPPTEVPTAAPPEPPTEVPTEAPPEPPTEVPPDPITATNTPAPPAGGQVTPVTQVPPEPPDQPPDQTPSGSIYTPVVPNLTATPPLSIYTPVVPPPHLTPASSIYTPVAPGAPAGGTAFALQPTERNLPWETNCARPNISTCNPPRFSISDLRADWQVPVRAAARTWNDAGTSFALVERVLSNSERTLVPLFYGGTPFNTVRLAPGEVRFVQLSRIYPLETPLRQAFDTFFRQKGVIAAALGYQDARNPGKRVAALVILNDYYPLSYNWTTLPANYGLDVQSVALHELGHVAGLDHGAITSDVMFSGPFDSALYLSKRALTSNDTANLAILYPAAATGAVTLPPDTAALAPGVYVQSIHPVPENPKRKQGVPFALTFINTTGSARRYTLIVQIVLAEDGHTFGETSAQSILLQPGVSEITTPDNWGVYGPGGCISFTARPFFRNEDNSRTQFSAPDGRKSSIEFATCPSS